MMRCLATAAWFTGSARIDPLFPAHPQAGTSGAYVSFEPGGTAPRR